VIMSVTFSAIPYESFRREFPDSEEAHDLRCYICTDEFSSKDPFEGHEGTGRSRHAIHRVCLQKDVERQDKMGRQAAQCSTCSKNILNSDSYLPWRSRIMKRVKEFGSRHKTLAGAALGVMSMFGGMLLAQGGGVPDAVGWRWMDTVNWPPSERIKFLPGVLGGAGISAMSTIFATKALNLETINSNQFVVGVVGGAVVAAIAHNGLGAQALIASLGIACGVGVMLAQARVP
jgi:hypothetical protein